MIGELLDKLTQRRTAKAGGFLDLAKRIAAGENVSVETADETLAATGKTPEELQAAVELCKRRMDWTRQLGTVEKLERERADLEGRIAEADGELEKAVEKRDARVAPMGARIRGIVAALASAKAARAQLRATCPDAELVAQGADLTARLAELRERAAFLRKESARIKSAETAENEAQKLGPCEKAEWWGREADRHRKAAAEAAKELPGVEKAIREAEAEQAGLFERMIAA